MCVMCSLQSRPSSLHSEHASLRSEGRAQQGSSHDQFRSSKQTVNTHIYIYVCIFMYMTGIIRAHFINLCVHMYMRICRYYICIYILYIHIYTCLSSLSLSLSLSIYIYIYLPGSSARFARAEDYGIILWDYITGVCYGIISWIILRDNITELYYAIV